MRHGHGAAALHGSAPGLAPRLWQEAALPRTGGREAAGGSPAPELDPPRPPQLYPIPMYPGTAAPNLQPPVGGGGGV